MTWGRQLCTSYCGYMDGEHNPPPPQCPFCKPPVICVYMHTTPKGEIRNLTRVKHYSVSCIFVLHDLLWAFLHFCLLGGRVSSFLIVTLTQQRKSLSALFLHSFQVKLVSENSLPPPSHPVCVSCESPHASNLKLAIKQPVEILLFRHTVRTSCTYYPLKLM